MGNWRPMQNYTLQWPIDEFTKKQKKTKQNYVVCIWAKLWNVQNIRRKCKKKKKEGEKIHEFVVLCVPNCEYPVVDCSYKL